MIARILLAGMMKVVPFSPFVKVAANRISNIGHDPVGYHDNSLYENSVPAVELIDSRQLLLNLGTQVPLH